MTEHDAALRFDQALDGTHRHELNGAEPLLETAQTVRSLFDEQRAVPSEAFVMRLERSLFPILVIPSGAEGPPAAAVSRPQPMPRPARIAPDVRRFTHSRLLAIAAVIALLLGGMGAIVGGPLDPRSEPEPSSIPAVSFGTAEASPEPVGQIWTVPPSPSTDGSDRPPVISNGIAFRTFMGSTTSPIQAVDLQKGEALWLELPRVSTDLVTATDDLVLVAGRNGNLTGFRYELIALDGQTGEERWSEALTSRPVGLKVTGDQIVVLGSSNLLESFDQRTRERRWQIDLSRFVDSMSEFDGLNKFTDLTGDRLAMTDGIIGTLLSNGRLIAVDAADGRLKWSDARRSQGWTRVKVVNGRFVVLAFGSGTLDYDPDATPVAFPLFDSTTDPCVSTLKSRSESVPETPPDIGETVDSFDPVTGASPWGLIAQEAYSISPVDDSRLVVQVGPGWGASIANNDEVFTCVIDGATGAVSETTGNGFATFVFTDSETGALRGIGASPSGVPLWVDHPDPKMSAGLPFFDRDPMQLGGFRWAQKTDGLILITAQDGTLIGLPENGPRWPSTDATATARSDDADIGWIAPAPEGIAEFNELGNQHVIADGRIFRAFSRNTSDPVIQAIDAATGEILWETKAGATSDFFMAAGGDVLLVINSYTSGGPQLVALDVDSGETVWSADLSDRPAALLVEGNQVLVLGNADRLDIIDLATGQVEHSLDIHGDAQRAPPQKFIDLSEVKRRMAVDGETLYASLGDGSVVAVDLETGAGKWWSLRPTPGKVDIFAVDRQLIVVDKGDSDAISAQFETERQAALSGTPLAEPLISALGLTPCTGSADASSPAATPIETSVPVAPTVTIRGLDTSTGAITWTSEMPVQSSPLHTIDNRLLYRVVGSDSGSFEEIDMALCALDPQTGHVHRIERLDELPGSRVLIKRSSDETPRSIAIVWENAEFFGVPVSFDPNIEAPIVTLDESVFDDGWWWEEFYEGALYASLNDGRLVKIPIPNE